MTAEAFAIETEKPLHNIAGTPKVIRRHPTTRLPLNLGIDPLRAAYDAVDRARAAEKIELDDLDKAIEKLRH